MKIKELLNENYVAFLKEYEIIGSENEEADLSLLWREVQTLSLELSYLEDKEYEMMLCRGILEILDTYDFE